MKFLRRWYWWFVVWNTNRQERAYARWLHEIEREATKKRRLLRMSWR